VTAREIFADQPSAVVTSGGGSASSGTETWTVSSSASFPAASSSGSPPSQFHVVDASPLYQSEIIAVTNISGTTWTVTRGAEGTTPVAHAADFTVVQVATAGWLGTVNGQGFGYPWQFFVKAYGARGDGIMLTDAAMSASSAVLTSASANFTSADAGKHILVNNAGSAPAADTSGGLFTTIASVQSSTQVTLAAAAARSVSSMTAMYGTDDTAAIQSAMNALMTYSGFSGQPYYAELLFEPAVYVLASMPVPGGNLDGGLTYGNAQIPLPVVDLTGTDPKPTIVVKGTTSDNSTLDSYHQSIPQIIGPCLFSMVEITNANHSDLTYGPVSVIGGPTVNAPFGGSNFFNNVLVVIDAIQVVCPPNPGQLALDFYYMAQFAIKTASLDVFASVTGTPTINFTGSGPTNTNGQGLRVPYAGLNDRCDIDSLTIEGYYYGMTLDEHVAARRVAIIYTNTAIYIPPTGGGEATHGAWIGYASLEICQYCIYVPNSGGGSLFGLVIGNLDNEGPVTAHIYDPSGYLAGTCNILPSQSALLPQTPVVTGAANWEILSMSQARGLVTAPAVPATTVALQNPFWRNASVIITSGGAAVTQVSVDGTATGLTLGTSGSVTVRVPSGHSVTLTYASTAPTWVWILD